MSNSVSNISAGTQHSSQTTSGHEAGNVAASHQRTRHIAIVTAGVGEPSTTTELARGIALKTAEILKNSGIKSDIALIELKNLAGDIAIASISLKISPALQQALQAVQNSDAVVVASPVYKATYSGLFKSFWDIADPDIVLGLPLAVVATGGSERHALVPDTVMRSLFAFMRAVIVPTGIMAATGDWGSTDLADHQARVAAELSALIVADIHRDLLDSIGGKYTRTFKAGSNAEGNETDWDEDDPAEGLDFDSSLMHLAAGGKQ